MEILEFGNFNNKTLVLVHGFQCPYTVLDSYIEYYKKDFHIIVPVMPGHNPKKKKEFKTIDELVKEFEDFYINRYGNQIYAVYGMSFGGVFGCQLWKNKKISIEKLILESSPLLSFGKRTISIMTWWYLKMASKVRAGNKRTLKKAENNIVPKKYLNDFKTIVCNMSDDSIRNYISQVGKFSLSSDELTKFYSGESSENEKVVHTKIIYFYGGKSAEIPFKKVGHFIKRHYKSSDIRKLKGKGHCEDSLLNQEQWIFTLNQIL